MTKYSEKGLSENHEVCIPWCLIFLKGISTLKSLYKVIYDRFTLMCIFCYNLYVCLK